MKKILFILTLLLALSTQLTAKEYAVVSYGEFQQLPATKIRAIFLKKLTLLNNTKLVPINLLPRDPLRKKFEKHVLKMSFSRLKAYWTKQHYLGHRPPVSLKSQASVASFLKKVKGSIGYLELKNIDNKMHILYKWSD